MTKFFVRIANTLTGGVTNPRFESREQAEAYVDRERKRLRRFVTLQICEGDKNNYTPIGAVITCEG